MLAGFALALGAPGRPASAAEPATSATHLDHGLLTGTWKRYRPKSFQINPQFTSSIPAPTDPPLKEPYLSQWKARQKAAHEADLRGQPLYSGYAACIPDGMPAMMMAMFPMDVLQTPGQITIIQEAYRQVRYIYLNQKQVPIEDAEPEFWGHSVGHWQGDTLFVNTVGIRPEVRYSDVPHSDQMQIDERIRLISKDRAEDRITITDPVYLTKPWNFTYEYERDPGYKMLEYVCENNREYRDPKTGGQRVELIGNSAAGYGTDAPATTGPDAKPHKH
ncbi:MAG TPA: hypothetical protein VN730_01970 [Steroidobacteraceae bacterium]|nr:hypothetical protein [Steroidobacteraceae bacterium]